MWSGLFSSGNLAHPTFFIFIDLLIFFYFFFYSHPRLSWEAVSGHKPCV